MVRNTPIVVFKKKKQKQTNTIIFKNLDLTITVTDSAWAIPCMLPIEPTSQFTQLAMLIMAGKHPPGFYQIRRRIEFGFVPKVLFSQLILLKLNIYLAYYRDSFPN